MIQPVSSELYARYGALIYARCRRLLGDPLAAELATPIVFREVRAGLAELTPAQALAVITRATEDHCGVRPSMRVVEAVAST